MSYKVRSAIEVGAKCQEEPINSASVEKGENEGNFLEVQTFERGIKNETMKGSRAC